MTRESQTIAAYRQMTRALRKLIDGPDAVSLPIHFLAEIDQILTTTEIAIKHGELPFAEQPDRKIVQALARWLWDRGFGSEELLSLPKERRAVLSTAAGAEPTDILWSETARLIAKMEARASSEPSSPLVVRNHLDEESQWRPEYVGASSKPPAPKPDPFKNSPRAEANRKAKAKVLARWLWDRNIDGATLLGFTPKYLREIARAAGANPPSTIDTWNVAVGLMAKMEARAAAEPNSPVTTRNYLDEHEKWATDPHATGRSNE
ncbi:hypothetical protein [Arthrobacter sp. A2-55]|uniref:hypothetical protein n=1 Tax=Arthrobacter sp. A2-55 TaxID=2897337 RepID=UPI0021CDE52C|nr:hypothetical protein [Arthrobacter sp. A2-55]MCU6479039.1 hypothetical protein [Arthrobacter sp. A2-55]